MDTTGGEELGRFWGAVLGLELRPDGASGDLVGATEGHGIAMCRVPEPKTVKHRVHLDVKTPSVAALEQLGASVVRPAEESGLRWTVMADPEGGEFCAFVRGPDDVPAYRGYALCVDAARGVDIARWWAEVLGADLATENDGEAWALRGVPGLPFDSLLFLDVPEPKAVKNRIHWDVYADPAEMEAAGATLLRARDGEIRWHVMADPEGNEFCVFGG
jgi:catechol 2,3-dioxygenase-like lactoylglutathione lyase family enzyme